MYADIDNSAEMHPKPVGEAQAFSPLGPLQNNLPVAMAIFDMEMRYRFASDRWLDAYQLHNCDLIGQSHYDIFPDLLNYSDHLEAHQRCLNGETLSAPHDAFEDNHGGIRYIRWTMSPWLDPASQQQIGVSLITEDVTEQHAASLENQRLIDELQIEIVGKALLQTQLIELSLTDSLTGLNNRRFIQDALQREIDAYQRTHSPLSVALLDADHFKSINDTHGHSAGDEVLIQLGGVMQEVMRKTDFCGRWGGEEFLLLLPNTNPSDAQHLAERLRKKVSETSFAHGEPVTVSLGLTSFEPQDTASSFIQRADQALYRAKQQGRNCTVLG